MKYMPLSEPFLLGRQIASVRPEDRFFRKMTEVVSLLAVLVLLADIPKIAFLPVSPRFLLLAVAIVLCFMHSRTYFVTALKEMPSALVWFLALILVVGSIKLSPRAVASCFEGFAVFVAIFCLMTCRPGAERRMMRTLALFYMASGIWMMLSAFTPEPFATIRQYVYAGHLGRTQFDELAMATPTGFAFNHYVMGYQLAVGVVLTLLLCFFEKGKWRILWLIGSFIGGAALIVSSQRSAILGVAAALSIFLLHTKRKGVLLMAIVVASVVFFTIDKFVAPRIEVGTISSKLENEQDYQTRLRWQFAALRIIAERPFGGLLEKLNWEEEAQNNGADFAYYGGDVKFVHNAYLGNALFYGWSSVLLILMMLRYVIRRMVMNVLDSRFAGCPSRPYALISVLAVISVMLQAMFHNANIFTLEPSSFTIFSSACACMWLLRRQKGVGC
jgi:hypothetical protein